MKTKCFATVNRFGFPLLNARSNPFLPCTTKRGAWQHDQMERVEAPSLSTVEEAPQIPLALAPT